MQPGQNTLEQRIEWTKEKRDPLRKLMLTGVLSYSKLAKEIGEKLSLVYDFQSRCTIKSVSVGVDKKISEIVKKLHGKDGRILYSEKRKELIVLIIAGYTPYSFLGKGMKPYEEGRRKTIVSWRCQKIDEAYKKVIEQRPELALVPSSETELSKIIELIMQREYDTLASLYSTKERRIPYSKRRDELTVLISAGYSAREFLGRNMKEYETGRRKTISPESDQKIDEVYNELIKQRLALLSILKSYLFSKIEEEPEKYEEDILTVSYSKEEKNELKNDVYLNMDETRRFLKMSSLAVIMLFGNNPGPVSKHKKGDSSNPEFSKLYLEKLIERPAFEPLGKIYRKKAGDFVRNYGK